MKKLTLLVLFACMGLSQVLYGQSDCNEQQIVKTIATMDSTLIVDVRGEEEYLEQHLDGAVNIPLEIVADSASIAKMAPYKNIVVVCGSGRRSKKAKEKLDDAGVANVYDGTAWTKLRDLIEEK